VASPCPWMQLSIRAFLWGVTQREDISCTALTEAGSSMRAYDQSVTTTDENPSPKTDVVAVR
jgi:hypothetical protein